MSEVARIDDLRVTFATDGGDVPAVRGISLEVREREVLAIVGESGSGKSVTAKSLLAMLPATASLAGTVVLSHDGAELTLGGASPAQLRAMRGVDVSMVFQEPSTALNPVYPIGWQFAEIFRAHRAELKRRGWTDKDFTRKAMRARSIELLSRVGIPDPDERVDHYAHQFSGGQKQRIIIAMALALNPPLIVADEPTTALDVTVQAEILALLRHCRDEFGASIVLITHNMGVVADLADRVAVMYRGEIVEQADVADLFAAPRHEYTKKLLAAVPKIGERVKVAEARPEGESARPLAVAASAMEVRYEGRFGKEGFLAVKDATFTIHAGEVVGLVGESGSGKTTTARAVAGLTKVTGGSLNVLGCEMNGVKEKDFRPLRSRIGFVFQDPAASFNPLMTIGQCIAEPLIVHGKESKARVAELLDAVELASSYAQRYPHELSGGQRQRASLARALALNPELLIADEPTSALDVSVQAAVLDLFLQLQQEFGFACLFISHDLAVIDEVSHSIVVMYRGEIVEQGVAREVLQRPTHPYTQRLLAALPVPDPVAQGERREQFATLPPLA